MRYNKYVLFIKIRNEITETFLSKTLSIPVNVCDIKPWHLVNQFAPPSFHISPHYRFHSALSQVRRLENIFCEFNFSTNRQQEIAKQILNTWQMTRNDFEVDSIINKIREEGMMISEQAEVRQAKML